MNDFDVVKINDSEDSLTFSNNKSQGHKLKGRNLIGRADNYVVIDIETTGLDADCDEIIEVAAARVRAGAVSEKFSSLIKPENTINEFIVNLTGITNEMVKTAPPPVIVLKDFVDFVGKGLIVGHNVNFDINFLYNNCREKIGYIFANDFIDTMRLSRRLFANENQHKLTDLINRFGIGTVVEHRALGDVLQTQKCYEYMINYSIKNNVKMKYLLANGKTFSERKRKVNEKDFDYMDNLFAD